MDGAFVQGIKVASEISNQFDFVCKIQNPGQTVCIRQRDGFSVDPSSHRIILKIVGF